MSDLGVVIGLVFLAFILVGFVAWFAYRGGYVAGFEDAVEQHNLAVQLRWHAAEHRPATRDGERSFPYRGEVD